jgi:hypothetical protein
MPSLIIMAPIRGRKANCERLIRSYEETADFADMVFILDPDDLGTYEGVDWGRTKQVVLDPRGMIGPKRNYAAKLFVNDYDALMCMEDDVTYGTKGWDTILMGELAKMGGTGMVYPNDDRRIDVPENVLISSDIVKALGWFCEPSMSHYYIDNAWADLGNTAGCLRFCPDVLFENFHYSMGKQESKPDKTYSEAEKLGPADRAAYLTWLQERLNDDVKTVRKVLGTETGLKIVRKGKLA